MDILNPCICCLRRPSKKNINTPYCSLGITEIYSDMIEGCFEIQLSLGNSNDDGICEVCVGRLRDARDFKLQVQRSQVELRARLEQAQQATDPLDQGNNETTTISIPDDEASDQFAFYNETTRPAIPHDGTSDQFAVYVQPPIIVSVISQAEELEVITIDDDVIPHDEIAKPAKSDDENSDDDDVEFTSYREPPVIYKEVDDDDVISRELTRDSSISDDEIAKPAISDDENSDDDEFALYGENVKSEISKEEMTEDPMSLSSQDVKCSHQSGSEQAVFARARQQLAMSCSVRLERLRDDKAPRARRTSRDTLEHAASLASRASHAQGHGTGPSDTRTYTCAPCGKRFARKTTLIKHLRKHMMQTRDQKGVNPLECEASKKQFTQKMNSMRRQRIHTGGKVCTCDICKAGFARKNRTHVVQKYSCEVCSNMFGTKACLTPLLHRRIHTEEKTYVCDICKKGFALKKYLIKHISTHMGQRFWCDICSKTLGTKIHLALHRRIHAGENPYTCDKCGKGFAIKKYLTNHIRTHTETFTCEVCSETFVTMSRLTIHREIHTGKKALSEERPHFGHDDIAALAGPTSRDTLEHAASLASRASHARGHGTGPSDTRTYTCDPCGKQFRLMISLIQHIRRHCKQPSKKLTGKGSSSDHETIISGLEPHSSDVLDSHLSSKTDLKGHKQTHTGEKPDADGDYKKCFTEKSTFLRLIREHAGWRPYSCEVCNKTFRNKHHLITHTLIHTGETPFSCEHCNQQFKLKCHLVRHKQIHMGKAFKCEVCNKLLRFKQGLARHMPLHTGEKIFTCEVCSKPFNTKRSLIGHQLIHKRAKCTMESKVKNHMRIHTGDMTKLSAVDYLINDLQQKSI